MAYQVRFSDSARQLLMVLVTEAFVRIRDDIEMNSAADELLSIMRKLSGTDTVLFAQRGGDTPAEAAEAG